MVDPKRLPRLPRRKLPTEAELLLLAEAEAKRKEQKEKEDLLKRWINNNHNFNVDTFIKKWDELKNKHTQTFLTLAIEAMSIADGAINANESLHYGFKMENADLRLDLIVQILERIVRIQTTAMIVQDTKLLSKSQKDNLINRVIAREFPTHDNAPKEPNKQTVTVPQQHIRKPYTMAEKPEKRRKIGNKKLNVETAMESID